MEVRDVYQDAEGKWHVDYSTEHLMGLAFRVYFGQFLVGLFVGIPLLVLSALVGAAVGKSLPKESNTSEMLNFHSESICSEPSHNRLSLDWNRHSDEAHTR
ncbi:MAG: hypothetical protein AAF716_23270 [Cyanobacteria bacterium P01_D01_bin.1]